MALRGVGRIRCEGLAWWTGPGTGNTKVGRRKRSWPRSTPVSSRMASVRAYPGRGALDRLHRRGFGEGQGFRGGAVAERAARAARAAGRGPSSHVVVSDVGEPAAESRHGVSFGRPAGPGGGRVVAAVVAGLGCGRDATCTGLAAASDCKDRRRWATASVNVRESFFASNFGVVAPGQSLMITRIIPEAASMPTGLGTAAGSFALERMSAASSGRSAASGARVDRAIGRGRRQAGRACHGHRT